MPSLDAADRSQDLNANVTSASTAPPRPARPTLDQRPQARAGAGRAPRPLLFVGYMSLFASAAGCSRLPGRHRTRPPAGCSPGALVPYLQPAKRQHANGLQDVPPRQPPTRGRRTRRMAPHPTVSRAVRRPIRSRSRPGGDTAASVGAPAGDGPAAVASKPSRARRRTPRRNRSIRNRPWSRCSRSDFRGLGRPRWHVALHANAHELNVGRRWATWARSSPTRRAASSSSTPARRRYLTGRSWRSRTPTASRASSTAGPRHQANVVCTDLNGRRVLARDLSTRAWPASWRTHRFRQLVEECAERYSLVFLVGPPVTLDGGDPAGDAGRGDGPGHGVEPRTRPRCMPTLETLTTSRAGIWDVGGA